MASDKVASTGLDRTVQPPVFWYELTTGEVIKWFTEPIADKFICTCGAVSHWPNLKTWADCSHIRVVKEFIANGS